MYSLSREPAKNAFGDDVAGALDASNFVVFDGERRLANQQRRLLRLSII
jgi:hypothetical protein